jgi:hypothetical protein
MQHERDPFGRRQRVQHHEERQPDRVREHRLLLGTGGHGLLGSASLSEPSIR